MTVKYLVKIDITGKQDYIFSSNRLKEIIGASEIIRFASEDLGYLVLNKIRLPKNVYFNPQWYDGATGNVLFIGGGNSTYIFDDTDSAKHFVKEVSRICFKHFDGLKLLIEQTTWNKEENLPKVIKVLDAKLSAKKRQGFNLLQQTGFGLVETCPNTGKAAGYRPFDNNEDSKVYAKETMSKLVFYNLVKKERLNEAGSERVIPSQMLKNMGNALKMDLSFDGVQPIDEKLLEKKYKIATPETSLEMDFLGKLLDKREAKQTFNNMPALNKSQFSYELDDIGDWKALNRQGNLEKTTVNGQSYVGIACLDGNGFGDLFRSFSKRYEAEDDRTYEENNLAFIKGYRKLSFMIDSLFYNAIEALTSRLYHHQLRMSGTIDKEQLIMRPIIVAGDDLTLITHGKLIMHASHILMEEMLKTYERFEPFIEALCSEKENSACGINVGVTTGVAIVPKKYPFAQAVNLAEDIQKTAKCKVAKINKEIHEASSDTRKEYVSGLGWALERGIIKKCTPNSERRNCIFQMQDGKDGRELFSKELNILYDFKSGLEQETGGLSKGYLADYFRNQEMSDHAAKLFMHKYGEKFNEEHFLEMTGESEIANILLDAIELMEFVEKID